MQVGGWVVRGPTSVSMINSIGVSPTSLYATIARDSRATHRTRTSSDSRERETARAGSRAWCRRRALIRQTNAGSADERREADNGHIGKLPVR
jgi:hypothetical protein